MRCGRPHAPQRSRDHAGAKFAPATWAPSVRQAVTGAPLGSASQGFARAFHQRTTPERQGGPTGPPLFFKVAARGQRVRWTGQPWSTVAPLARLWVEPPAGSSQDCTYQAGYSWLALAEPTSGGRRQGRSVTCSRQHISRQLSRREAASGAKASRAAHGGRGQLPVNGGWTARPGGQRRRSGGARQPPEAAAGARVLGCFVVIEALLPEHAWDGCTRAAGRPKACRWVAHVAVRVPPCAFSNVQLQPPLT